MCKGTSRRWELPSFQQNPTVWSLTLKGLPGSSKGGGTCRDGGWKRPGQVWGRANPESISLLLTSILPPGKDSSCLCYPEAPWKALAQQSAASTLSAVPLQGDRTKLLPRGARAGELSPSGVRQVPATQICLGMRGSSLSCRTGAVSPLWKDGSAHDRLQYALMNMHSSKEQPSLKRSKVLGCSKMLISHPYRGCSSDKQRIPDEQRGAWMFHLAGVTFPCMSICESLLSCLQDSVLVAVTLPSPHLHTLCPKHCPHTVPSPVFIPVGKADRTGGTNECKNNVLPGMCLIYRHQLPSGHTVPTIPFPKHHSYMWAFMK